MKITDCPNCGAESALETMLRIDLDDVVVDDETNEVVSFILAGSANDPFNGIVVEEARVLCRDCGHELKGVTVPLGFSNRWVYYDTSPRVELAQKLCHLLNRGDLPREALASLGIEPDDVSTEEGLSLDDPDNGVIDLLLDREGLCPYVQRHGDRWHVHVVQRED
jgi:hypothetical protein